MIINLPHDVFTSNKGTWNMYDKFTRQLKVDYVIYWFNENHTFLSLPMNEVINVPDSTNTRLTYMFKVTHKDNEFEVVTLEWLGIIQ